MKALIIKGINFESSPARIDATDAAPKWNKLFPVGTTRYRRDFPGGKLSLSRDFLAAMISNWERMGRPALPVDFAHDETGVASGWIEGLELRGDGLYGLVRWTDDARNLITADKLRYLSPTFHPDATDTLSGERQGPTLLGAALLNNPFLFDLPRVAASAASESTHPPADEAQTQEQRMEKKSICAALGLPEDTADEKVLATLKERLQPKTALLSTQDVAEAVKLAAEPLKVQLAEAKEQSTKLAAELEAMRAEKKAADVEGFVVSLEREGKMVPAAREATKQLVEKMGLEFAKTYFAAAPVLAPIQPVGHGGGGTKLTPQAAHLQLCAKADELVKAGVPRSESMIRALNLNPELARAAKEI